jgi:hypothetical protein
MMPSNPDPFLTCEAVSSRTLHRHRVNPVPGWFVISIREGTTSGDTARSLGPCNQHQLPTGGDPVTRPIDPDQYPISHGRWEVTPRSNTAGDPSIDTDDLLDQLQEVACLMKMSWATGPDEPGDHESAGMDLRKPA